MGAPRGYFWFFVGMAAVAFLVLIGRGVFGHGWSMSTITLMICMTWFAAYARPRKRARDE